MSGPLGPKNLAVSMPDLRIKMVYHSDQRYDTVGDWRQVGDTLLITVSRLSDRRSEIAVIVHEVVEALLCEVAGITDAEVDAFDFAEAGTDPGANPAAPYHAQHLAATDCEGYVAKFLDLDWDAHNVIVDEPLKEPESRG